MAGDMLEAHANLLPIDLLFRKVTFRAAARIASLPPAHPLSSPARKASKRFVQHHHSPLHNLFELLNIDPHVVEPISPVHHRSNYTPAFITSIPLDKPTALAQAINNHNTKVSMYCDGSGYEGGIGASAVLYINSIERHSLQYHLGLDTEHTVYEAEIAGLLLALHLLSSLMSSPCSPVIIGSDSQATIRVLMNQRSHPVHHLLNHIHTLAEHLHATHYKLRHPSTPLSAKQLCADYQHDVLDLQIHWTPGHVDFPPNERADAVAKSTAAGTSSPSRLLPPFLHRKPLPHSIPALRHTNLTQLHYEWKRRWKRSPRFRYTSRIDNSLPSNSYLKLINGLDRSQSAILTQLCTAHSPLNQHLFRIHRSVMPVCPHCGRLIPETVTHYLLQCPHYQYEHHILRCKLKRKADSLPFLLSDSVTTLPLLKFICGSKRFAPAPPPIS